MKTPAVGVNLDTKGQITLQLLGSDQGVLIVIEIQFLRERREKALHQSVMPTALPGGHAATDLMLA